jgi:hypothetical protein
VGRREGEREGGGENGMRARLRANIGTRLILTLDNADTHLTSEFGTPLLRLGCSTGSDAAVNAKLGADLECLVERRLSGDTVDWI